MCVLPDAARRSAPADGYVLLAGHVLFVVLLGLAATRATIAAADPLIPLVLTLLLAGWYGVGAIWAAYLSRRVLRWWLAGLIVLWLIAVVASGEFVWLAFMLALLVWHLFPVVAAIPIEVVIAVAAVVGFNLHQGRWVIGAIIGPVIGIGVAAGMTEVYQRLRAQSEERKRLLDELLRTQRALADRERESGRSAERERLAREIHDTVGQSLTSIILLLKAIRGASGGLSAEQGAQLDTALDTASGALGDTRRFVRGLDPESIERGGLVSALRALAVENADLGLPTSYAQDGVQRPLPTAVQVALLRAAQEALSNVRKHAHATRATLTLTFQDDEVSIDVVDDGAGFDPAHLGGRRADGSGFGLTSMRSRIEERGGELTVESHVGEGTAVRATVPTREVDGTEPGTLAR